MPGNPISEQLVALLHAISEDNSLCERLLSLGKLPVTLRQAALLRIADQMRSADEDESVISAISALVQPRTYDAACRPFVNFSPDTQSTKSKRLTLKFRSAEPGMKLQG